MHIRLGYFGRWIECRKLNHITRRPLGSSRQISGMEPVLVGQLRMEADLMLSGHLATKQKMVCVVEFIRHGATNILAI